MSLRLETRHHFTTLLEHRLTLDVGVPALFLLLWASGFSVVKIGLRYADPLTFLTIRYACVVAILLPVQIGLTLPLPRTARHWADLCLIGFLIQFVYFVSNYLALWAGLSAGALALIVSLQPILVGLVAPLWLKERVSGKQWIGLALGFAGAAIVIATKTAVGITSVTGIAFAIAALIGMTCGVLYEKKTGSSTHAIAATLIQSAVGLFLVGPLALALEHGHVEWTSGMFFSLAYLVIGNSLVAIMLLLFLVRNRQAARVSALFFLVPPCAAIAANILVHETMPAVAWAGIGLAAVGVWISNRK